MSLSYDYEKFIREIEEEIEAGVLCPSDIIQILRSKEEIFTSYRAIEDWYYSDIEINELVNENPEDYIYLMKIKYEKDKEFLEKNISCGISNRNEYFNLNYSYKNKNHA